MRCPHLFPYFLFSHENVPDAQTVGTVGEGPNGRALKARPAPLFVTLGSDIPLNVFQFSSPHVLPHLLTFFCICPRSPFQMLQVYLAMPHTQRSQDTPPTTTQSRLFVLLFLYSTYSSIVSPCAALVCLAIIAQGITVATLVLFIPSAKRFLLFLSFLLI
uniref:Uncharacterized protein n=1 Tax=Trypanosoma vivax (strain Y486) TaxID=1055687 RepID=G0U1A5_TRYVY|nr:conserved hypothetical protein [Trypanosoma vivax Y486]